MTDQKKSTPLEGDYRTLMVEVNDEAQAETKADLTQDAPVPEPLATSMQRLDFSDLETDQQRQARATAANSVEERLVAYFDGTAPWADDLVAIFLQATRGPDVNDDLFRRYLNQGNPRLMNLLTHAVEAHPTDRDLLYDLAYLTRGSANRGDIILRYRSACAQESDPERFRSLVTDFFELILGDDPTASADERQYVSDDPRKLALYDFVADQYNT